LVIVCFTFYKLNREKTESSLNFKIKKQFLNYSFWGNTHAFLDLPVSHLDRIIISAVFSVELVGVFNLVKRIGGIVKQLADPVLQILFPKFIDCLKCGNVNQIKIVISQLRIVSFLLAFLTLFVGFFGYEIIEKAMFAGEMADYKYEILAFSIVQVYAFSYIWIHPLCISLSAMREVTIITLVSNVIYLVMLVIGVNYLDMYGVVLATLIQYAIVIQLKKNIIRDKFIDW
ncbi:oligosaccharide flippase family protein, partial [Photobacterium swingsii]|uniref:lipopolysaccharide biosynthesis protein n=1 Tax=Photobacterium swingsii TaxID=680026 RepID=UPI003D13D1D1